MNVFLFTSVPLDPPWDQGDKNFAITLARALPDIQFTALSTRENHSNLMIDNVRTIPFYYSAKPTIVEKFLVYLRLLTMAGNPDKSEKTPDIYHLIYRPYSLSSTFLKTVPDMRKKPTVHTMPASADKHEIKRDQFFASRTVVYSQYGLQKLKKLGVKNVVRIPPGIDVSEWAILSDIPETLKTLQGNSGQPTILFPGHYGEGQGSDTLLAALPIIIEHIPEVCVLLACRLRTKEDINREASFKQAVNDMGISHAVRYYNTISDMKQMIGASDIVVLPIMSMRDKVDIPTTLLEVLAAGKPMVISDIPPMNEIVNEIHGNNVEEVGITVPPNDHFAFAEAVIELLKDKFKRQVMGLNGQQLIRNSYDIKNVARQYQMLYKEILA